MNDYSSRLHRVIPGGAHTYSRGDDQFPSNAPQILEKGLGAYVWDPEGNSFLDYGMALRAVTLGYAHPDVNRAACNAIGQGVNLTRATTLELRAAEELVDLIPSADMVKFGKNGSNVTTAAVKIARAYTGRRYVCVPRQHPFFSFDDWFIGTTALKRGIPDDHAGNTLLFDYGDIASLEALFEQYPGQIAAVMLEPATTQVPCEMDLVVAPTSDDFTIASAQGEPNFLQQVQSRCRKNGALFILDEMITGFRWHLRGAQTYFGVDPDMTTFGKGMANGFSVAAVVGKRDIMEVGSIRNAGTERTFLLSTTHGGEMPGLAALLETMRIYREQAVVQHLWQYGARLFNGMRALSEKHGLQKHFVMDGCAISMNYVTRDAEGQSSLPMRTLFSQEMVKRGVLMPWVAVSLAHNDTELEKTLSAVDEVLAVYRQALERGVEHYLSGPSIKPVFRQFN